MQNTLGCKHAMVEQAHIRLLINVIMFYDILKQHLLNA